MNGAIHQFTQFHFQPQVKQRSFPYSEKQRSESKFLGFAESIEQFSNGDEEILQRDQGEESYRTPRTRETNAFIQLHQEFHQERFG